MARNAPVTHYRKAGRVSICGKTINKPMYLKRDIGEVSCRVCSRMYRVAGLRALLGATG